MNDGVQDLQFGCQNAFSTPKVIRQIVLQQTQSQVDTKSITLSESRLLSTGDGSIPSSLYFTMREYSVEKEKERNIQQSLKNLSLMVKNYISQHDRCTYKQLTEELMKEQQNNLNFKRRVYDSINVMIALDVLNRNKKIITKGKLFAKNYGHEVVESLRAQRDSRAATLKEKKQLFTTLLSLMKKQQNEK